MPGGISKPKPFSRASVEISTEKREWKSTPVYSIQVGDLVHGNGRGTVTQVSDSPEGIRLFFQNGNSENFSEGESLFAFVKV